MPIIILIGLILIVVFVSLGIKYYRQRRREKLKSEDLKSEWINILEKNLPVYNRLPDDLRDRLHGLINVFLHEKVFSGYNGLEINDEIRVTIAAQACVLLLNRDEELYPSLKNVYVYPGAFRSVQTTSDGMVNTVEEVTRIGESWHRGHVVLSWQHSKQGAREDDDGHNVVYHEFAHQLDHQDGAIDGTPVLDTVESYRAWSRVFSDAYFQLRDKVSTDQSSIIDAYGAQSEGEFFAVVTELFFERPQLLLKAHPELYNELKQFYRLDPHQWV